MLATFQHGLQQQRISTLLLSLILLFSLQWADSVYIPPGPKYPCPTEANQLYPCVCLQGADTGLVIFIFISIF